MNALELLDVTNGWPSIPPPPAYSEHDPNAVRDDDRNNGGGNNRPTMGRTIMAVFKRQDCVDYRVHEWPGCCRRCALVLILDAVLMCLAFFVTVVSATVLIKSPGWMQTPFIVVISITFLCATRTTAFVSHAMSSVCRIAQGLFMVLCTLLLEVSVSGGKGKADDYSAAAIGPVTRADPGYLGLFAVLCLALSAAAGAIHFRFFFECVWVVGGGFWKLTVVISLCIVSIGTSTVIMCSDPWIRPTIGLCATGSILSCLRDPGRSVSATCLYRRLRFSACGSVAPLGRARCPRRNRDDPRLTEDDVSCFDGRCVLLDVFAALLLCLTVPLAFALDRRNSSSFGGPTYSELLLIGTSSVTCGAGAGFATTNDRRGGRSRHCISPGRLATGFMLLFALVIILTGCRLGGVVLYAVGVGMACAIVLVSLRSYGRHNGHMLALSCFARVILCAMISCAISSGPAAWVVDVYLSGIKRRPVKTTYGGGGAHFDYR